MPLFPMLPFKLNTSVITNITKKANPKTDIDLYIGIFIPPMTFILIYNMRS